MLGQAGGVELIVDTLPARPTAMAAEQAAPKTRLRRLRGWLVTHRQIGFDIGAVLLAVSDVLIDPPPSAQAWENALSVLACLALVARRRFPFTVTILTFPGLLTGWAN